MRQQQQQGYRKNSDGGGWGAFSVHVVGEESVKAEDEEREREKEWGERRRDFLEGGRIYQ